MDVTRLTRRGERGGQDLILVHQRLFFMPFQYMFVLCVRLQNGYCMLLATLAAVYVQQNKSGTAKLPAKPIAWSC